MPTVDEQVSITVRVPRSVAKRVRESAKLVKRCVKQLESPLGPYIAALPDRHQPLFMTPAHTRRRLYTVCTGSVESFQRNGICKHMEFR